MIRLEFADHLTLADVESTLVLALVGAEAIHGAAAARLQARYSLHRKRRVCVADDSTRVGTHFCRLLVQYLAREFGAASFRVLKVDLTKRSSRLRGLPKVHA